MPAGFIPRSYLYEESVDIQCLFDDLRIEMSAIEEELDSAISPGQPTFKVPATQPGNNDELPNLDFTDNTIGL